MLPGALLGQGPSESTHGVSIGLPLISMGLNPCLLPLNMYRLHTREKEGEADTTSNL